MGARLQGVELCDEVDQAWWWEISLSDQRDIKSGTHPQFTVAKSFAQQPLQIGSLVRFPDLLTYRDAQSRRRLTIFHEISDQVTSMNASTALLSTLKLPTTLQP
jgi:hypothetical protein